MTTSLLPRTTNFETAVAEYGENRVTAEPFGDLDVAVQALIDGDIDAVVIEEIWGQGYINDSADQLMFVDGALVSEELGFIFPKGSALVQPVNAALESMRADGTGPDQR